MNAPIFIYNAPVPEMAGSIALQALIPARHIGAKALYFGDDMSPKNFLDTHSPPVLVITKMFDAAPLALAEAAMQRGIKIVGVFCDLHVADVIGQRNKALCDVATAAVAPTASMAKLVQQHFGKSCLVIEEPVEYPRGAPRFTPSKPLRMLWLGHASNHDTLVDGLKALAALHSWPLTMILVSGQSPNLPILQNIAPNVPLRAVPWSPLIQFNLLDECDLVFIPSKDDPSKHAKGQARLVAAIQAGRVAIAHPLPQYEELSGFCYCTRDYAQGIEKALAEPSAALARVVAGQREIDARFSQEAVAAKWMTIINGL